MFGARRSNQEAVNEAQRIIEQLVRSGHLKGPLDIVRPGSSGWDSRKDITFQYVEFRNRWWALWPILKVKMIRSGPNCSWELANGGHKLPRGFSIYSK